MIVAIVGTVSTSKLRQYAQNSEKASPAEAARSVPLQPFTRSAPDHHHTVVSTVAARPRASAAANASNCTGLLT